jgi:hypothetical protein
MLMFPIGLIIEGDASKTYFPRFPRVWKSSPDFELDVEYMFFYHLDVRNAMVRSVSHLATS